MPLAFGRGAPNAKAIDLSEHHVTHCLTIGSRPDLLRETLKTLSELADLPTLAINDFGDAETNEVFCSFIPGGRIVGPGHHIGHHAAIDALYAEVKTPYIFHNEDDWAFHREDFVDDAIRLLEADPKISAVCMRDSGDFPMSDDDRAKILVQEVAGVAFQSLTEIHDQWHGYTFNPTLVRKSLWEDLGGFSRFAKERHISRHLRAKGMHVALLLPSACRHIGENRTTTQETKPRLKAAKIWLRNALGIRR